MPTKSLTIDVNPASVPSGSQDKWSPLNNTTVFIKAITTPPLTGKTNIGQIVSGIPTAFARVDLFKTALDHVATNSATAHNPGGQVNNLIGYYTRLVDEWKGLIACMALDYAHITVRKIDLAYSDGNDVLTTANVYEPKGAFGNMLLRRISRWRPQIANQNQEAVPFINVIKYSGAVVGGTSPESLLFTSTGYKCEVSQERPWIDAATGKFTDPLRSDMTPLQIATLHAYVSYLLDGLGEIAGYYGALPASEQPDYKSIRTVLENWRDAISQRAQNDGVNLSIGSTPAVSATFEGPFKKLFCYKDILYGQEGIVSKTAQNMSNPVEFDPKDLLLDEKSRIAKIELDITEADIPYLPILLLTADVKGKPDQKAYFALPLSAKGLNVFGKNIAALVGMSGIGAPIKSSLKAVYDPNARNENLEVILTLIDDSQTPRELKKVYTADGEIKNKDILIWPNFISGQWDHYYMYNELPHNGTSQTYRAFPFVGEMQDGCFRIIVDKDNKPVLLSQGGNIVAPRQIVDSDLLVLSNETVADNSYKYEIYRSNKPFKGVRLQSPTGEEGGYLIVNYSSALDTKLPKDWMLNGTPYLNPVKLGIDFGSTNTSIAYSSTATQEQGFDITNQRVSLLGKELPGRPVRPRPNQILFFPGAGTNVKSNAIKSVLTLHDPRRLKPVAAGMPPRQRDEQAVVGGFPCFAENLPFIDSDNSKITLHFPNSIGNVTQVHNMKWEDSDVAIAQKSAFLRTLMLQVYANLFVNGYVPESVKWSYPSAMNGPLLHSYQLIWNGLTSVVPAKDTQGNRYPLTISQYIPRNNQQEPGGFPVANQENANGFGGNFNADLPDFNAVADGQGPSSFGNESENAFGGAFGSAFNEDLGGGFGEFGGDSDLGISANGAPEEDFRPDDPNRKVEYDAKLLYPDAQNINGNAQPALSEAEAVANFTCMKYAAVNNVLYLCFDVGGSTTDISALFNLLNSVTVTTPTGTAEQRRSSVTMIKQNSIRFAAQRVSKAVSKFPGFRTVLSDICDKYGIQMVGLTTGGNTYNEHTAPYFFDQIVNRLDDSQLNDLYSNIAANCPQLMCVNMYVTGLLMYYAGQISNKLVDDLLHTSSKEWTKERPLVRITFAGKGSRLFQWLNVIGSDNAQKYYRQMFILGYGIDRLKQTLANWPQIILPQTGNKDIKYEVSKGLAKGNTKLYAPQNDQPSEIIGEMGFQLTGSDRQTRPINFTNSLTPAMLASIGDRLSIDNTARRSVKFTEFCAFFYKAASHYFGWSVNPNELQKACADLSIEAYIQNMPEYREAQEQQMKGNAFDFVAPIIILEGMEFYDQTLMNLL